MPTQFGPTIRSRCGFAASSIACCSAAPLAAPAPRIRRKSPPRPSCRAARVRRSVAGTSAAGLAITARSGADRQRGDRAVRGHVEDPVVVRIHRKDRPREAGAEQIFEQLAAHRRRPVACADQRNRAGLQCKIEIADRHETATLRERRRMASLALHARVHRLHASVLQRTPAVPMSQDAERDDRNRPRRTREHRTTQDQLLPLLLDVQRRLGHVPQAPHRQSSRSTSICRAPTCTALRRFYHDLRDAPRAATWCRSARRKRARRSAAARSPRTRKRRLGVAHGNDAGRRARHARSRRIASAIARCGPTVRIGDDDSRSRRRRNGSMR